MNDTWICAVALTLSFWLAGSTLLRCDRKSYRFHNFLGDNTLIARRSSAFLVANNAAPWRCRTTALGAGWGRTEHYTWNEDNKHVFVTVVVQPTIEADDIEVKIEPNSIHVLKKKSLVPLVSGNTKGSIDVDGSFWTIEETNGVRQLKLSLKKSEKEAAFWHGVIKNEVVQQQAYDAVQLHDVSISKSQSVEPGGVFWRREFPTIDAYQLQEILHRWMSRESTKEVPYGKPKLPVNVTFIHEGAGGKLIYASDHPEVDEYMEILVRPVITEDNKHSGGGSEVICVNSPTTHILSGELGVDQADSIKMSLGLLLQAFERDVHKLEGLIKHKQEEDDQFNYMGSAAFLDTENLQSYVRYHKELRKMSPSVKGIMHDPKKVYEDEEVGVKIDWNNTDAAPNVPPEENEHTKQLLVQQLTEAVKHTKKVQPEDTIKSLVTDVKQKLALSEKEYTQLMLDAEERISKENLFLEEKQKLVSHFKSVAAIDESQPSEGDLEVVSNSTPDVDTFDIAMKFPEGSVLAKKYETLSSVQKEQLRCRWKSNEKRLQLLITELMQSRPEKCATICNNYRDLLVSEDYPTLMRSYLCFNKAEGEHEKERLMFLNEFVLSLYKDHQIFLINDEKIQLLKIKKIMDWARSDLNDVNDMMMKNKQMFDTNFLCYLNLAISKEAEAMREENAVVPLQREGRDPRINPWLCILTIIHRAVTSLIKADMAEDVYMIGLICDFDNPKVRSYLLEFMLATMPRSDWKSFKDLIISASESLKNRPPEERNDLEGAAPHFVEAIMQLRDEVEKMIPDWVIDELLSEDDRRYMIENNRLKCPVLQLDLEPKKATPPATQIDHLGAVPSKVPQSIESEHNP